MQQENSNIPQLSQDRKGLTRSGTSGQLISKLLPTDYRNISQVIQSNLPSIAKIRKQDPEVAQMVVVEFVTDLVEFLNVGKTMNPDQINKTSDYILKFFPHLNLADLRLFFDKMKLGHYGKFYDSVDGQLILSKMEEYSQDRMDEYEQMRLAQHKDDITMNPIGEGYHPSVIQAIKNALGEKKARDVPASVRTQTPAEVFSQRCIRQFDNLFDKYGYSKPTGRFIRIGDTVFDLNQFLNRKFQNASTS